MGHPSVMRRTRAPLREPDRIPWTVQAGRILRRYFITGLATLFPVAVTLYLLLLIFKFTDGLLGKLLGIQIPGLGLVLTLLITLVVGVLSTHFFGRFVFPTLEQWFGRLPLVKKIYPAVKQLAGFIFTEEGAQPGFRRVVLVQFPRPGAYSIAFVTNEQKATVIGSSHILLTLLVPTPPSPFTGPIIFVPKEDIIPLTLSVEQALKLVVSGGIVAPPLQARAPSEPSA